MSPEERDYYSRQLKLAGFGAAAQTRLQRASALVVGVGGLGAPAALYLAGAGVGRMTLVDGDTVQTSNLHRQIIFTSTDVGRRKVDAALDRLRALNPFIRIEGRDEYLNKGLLTESLVKDHDIVLDCTDNFESKYALNEACVAARRPLVSASVSGFRGQLAVFNCGTGTGPCYRCLFPEAPRDAGSCAEVGVLGAIPGVLGTLQATEAIHLLLDPETNGRFLIYDANQVSFTSFSVRRDPDCPSCGERRRHACDSSATAVDVATLFEWLAQKRPILLVDLRSPEERAQGFIPGSVHRPLASLLNSEEKLPETDGPLVFYCQSGVRSLRALAMMESAARPSAFHLVGGFAAWKRLRKSPCKTPFHPDEIPQIR